MQKRVFYGILCGFLICSILGASLERLFSAAFLVYPVVFVMVLLAMWH
jgi:hypothetical protein